jgi:RimJ/RimL family protein N-acetyltransferase
MWLNPPCPLLPEVSRLYVPHDLSRLGSDRGPLLYETALHYAQSQWRAGFPAKSLLMVNRAFGCVFPHTEEVLRRHPLPYAVVVWLLQNRVEEQFIGNPRRHFQHLATRMVEPHKELRTWRAWACWYLSRQILPETAFPADLKQIREETLVEPTRDEIARQLERLSPANDVIVWQEALRGCQLIEKSRSRPPRVNIRAIGADELPKVRRLAHTIWPQVYPGIISMEQIQYMLARFYDVEVMSREMHERGACYALIELNGLVIGYLSFDSLPRERGAFLNKLYLLPEHHGVGAGASALDWVESKARRLSLQAVRLRVNRNNAPAIRAYLRAGFIFLADDCQEIGGGFVMDDFVMEKAFR